MELSYFNVLKGGNVDGGSAERQKYVTVFFSVREVYCFSVCTSHRQHFC